MVVYDRKDNCVGRGTKAKTIRGIGFIAASLQQEVTRVANLRSIAFLCAGRIGIPPHLEYRMFTTKWSATYCLGMPRVKGPSEA